MVGADDFLKNIICFGVLDKWLRILVMHGYVFLDGGDQFSHALEDSML